jgi:hypothetical protein
MEGSNLLIELLWEDVYLTLLIFGGFSVLPELNLGKSLVGK